MQAHKAWMSPEGIITEVDDHHKTLTLTGTTNPDAAVARGWTRLWAHPRWAYSNDSLVAQGRLEKIEEYKNDMLAWANYPKQFSLQVLLPDGRQVSVQGESEDLMERPVQSLVYRTRMVERPLMARRRDIRVVRGHRRRSLW